jgi:hypothetical protein
MQMTRQLAVAGSDDPGDYKTITVNGAELAYLERGSGDAVIFVHGSISDLRIWEKQMAAFPAGHRAIAYAMKKVLVLAIGGAGGDLRQLMAAAGGLLERGHRSTFVGDAAVARLVAEKGLPCTQFRRSRTWAEF